MLEWLRAHDEILVWSAAVSVVCLIASAIAVPIAAARIPTDYYAHPHREVMPSTHPALRLTTMILRNAIGGTLFLAGVAMLVLPGQGIITMLIGLLVMRFPGKFELERRIVRLPAVLRGLNWIRRRRGVQPLEV